MTGRLPDGRTARAVLGEALRPPRFTGVGGVRPCGPAERRHLAPPVGEPVVDPGVPEQFQTAAGPPGADHHRVRGQLRSEVGQQAAGQLLGCPGLREGQGEPAQGVGKRGLRRGIGRGVPGVPLAQGDPAFLEQGAVGGFGTPEQFLACGVRGAAGPRHHDALGTFHDGRRRGLRAQPVQLGTLPGGDPGEFHQVRCGSGPHRGDGLLITP
ncbi:hypothetical protein SHKM778_52760 [Streptomyces sp. KM77-8]|uniref:Uncharacterized protein n=1 Tax=Streptomyces haneummycinicus TaxID=3074435 RepID=A0AAT9HNY0_9ACTN